MTEQSIVLPLDDPAAELALVGGKGASLARLSRAGLPVPVGFHVTTEAYRDFVSRNGLREPIQAAVSDETAERAAQRIGELFTEHPIPQATAEAIRKAYAVLGNDTAVAVRSSATAEDLPDMSFAGQQDSYLDIRGEAALLDAVKHCWASLWTARAIGYRARNGVAPGDVALAVVVQELVPADVAGIAFTADPVTGAGDRVSVNAAWGLGEAVVGGRVTPDTYVVDRASGRLVEQQTGEKTVMTVRTAEGTREESVPADRRTQPVLGPEQAVELARIGVRVEELYGVPMDVEWALHGSRFFVVQARPITGLREPDDRQETEEWNDSLAGDYLWTNANLGEAIPSVMTPCTWSLVQIFMANAMIAPEVADHPLYGNIGGRFYMNLSITYTTGVLLGIRRTLDAANRETFGRLPGHLEIPLIPISRWRLVRFFLTVSLPHARRLVTNVRRMPEFLATAEQRGESLRVRAGAASSTRELLDLWESELEPFLVTASQMLQAAGKQGGTSLISIRRDLREMLGEADANALTSGLHGDDNKLASLGPVVGLARLARGEIDRETYAWRYGHRSPDEFEVSLPRQAEDPDWIDNKLTAAGDVDALLTRQDAARAQARERLERRYPRKAAKMRRRIDRWAKSARDRESTRSEVIRVFWALRAFVLRAGQLTGHGDDLFFLTSEEILDVLRGNEESLGRVQSRRRTYQRYRSLPGYPAVIRGRFDPFRWAADPNRRSDVFDEHGEQAAASDTVTGFPGAVGVVEGRARVIATADEGERLQAGEILVTTVTNVGWTPLFPRAAAVVTDVGAPLSHAAIVARELGIPAVVGCGNATMRLRTGDRLRVDGEHGTVQVL